MKKLLLLLLLCGSVLTTLAQQKEAPKPDPRKKLLTLEAGCGQCVLGLPGKDCDLAVRYNGKAYFVEGTHIDAHGDAHAEDGFCNAIRTALVQGELVKDRFKVTYFQLVRDSTKGPSPVERR